MIILHNSHDEISRDWIAKNATEGDTILDWYNEADRATWVRMNGTAAISAFPCVVTDIPEHTEPKMRFLLQITPLSLPQLVTSPSRFVAASQDVYRMPRDRMAVSNLQANLDRKVALCQKAKSLSQEGILDAAKLLSAAELSELKALMSDALQAPRPTLLGVGK